MNVKSPISYLGGKRRLASKIIALFPEHGDVVNLFEVLRDPALAGRLHASLEATPYSRAQFDRCLLPRRPLWLMHAGAALLPRIRAP